MCVMRVFITKYDSLCRILFVVWYADMFNICRTPVWWWKG